jgi:hypothetical protein
VVRQFLAESVPEWDAGQVNAYPLAAANPGGAGQREQRDAREVVVDVDASDVDASDRSS